jgi:hypothetical protein
MIPPPDQVVFVLRLSMTWAEAEDIALFLRETNGPPIDACQVERYYVARIKQLWKEHRTWMNKKTRDFRRARKMREMT